MNNSIPWARGWGWNVEQLSDEDGATTQNMYCMPRGVLCMRKVPFIMHDSFGAKEHAL